MRQGEIWLVDLNPTIGSEMQKVRPCIILSSDSIGKLPLKVIAPLTDFKESYTIVPWMVTLEPNADNGLQKRSTIDLFQVRSLSQKRLVRKIGSVDSAVLSACEAALALVFRRD